MRNGSLRKWMMCAVVSAATASAGRVLTAQEDVLIPGRPIEYSVQPLNRFSTPHAGNYLFALANDEGAADEAAKSEYWLGVQIAALPDVAKQQLGIEEGLAVEEVMPDSPAAKAEIKKFDILVKAGDTPLKEAIDLIKSVDASQGKELTITIIRGGKDRTVKVVATKRPEKERVEVRVPKAEFGAEIKRLEEALENLKNKAGKDGLGGFWFARPGYVSPRVELKGAPFPKDLKGEFPKDLSVQINKHGTEPTKIHVKRGDKEWDVTEDKLGELPDDIRPHVQKLLGRMLMPGLSATADRIVRVTPEGKVEGELKIAPMPPRPPAVPVPPVRVRPPAPPAAPAAPGAPETTRTFSYRLERGDGGADSKLDAILKKLDTIESGALDKLDKEVKQLRKEIDELRSKSK
jgi:PDZ domain-containing protein